MKNNIVYPDLHTYGGESTKLPYWSEYSTIGVVLGGLVLIGILYSVFFSGKGKKKENREDDDKALLA